MGVLWKTVIFSRFAHFFLSHHVEKKKYSYYSRICNIYISINRIFLRQLYRIRVCHGEKMIRNSLFEAWMSWMHYNGDLDGQYNRLNNLYSNYFHYSKCCSTSLCAAFRREISLSPHLSMGTYNNALWRMKRFHWFEGKLFPLALCFSLSELTKWKYDTFVYVFTWDLRYFRGIFRRLVAKKWAKSGGGCQMRDALTLVSLYHAGRACQMLDTIILCLPHLSGSYF